MGAAVKGSAPSCEISGGQPQVFPQLLLLLRADQVIE
jgi:hypothetical protein